MGWGFALCFVEKIRGAVEGGGDQSEHEIDMHKKQIHSLKAEHRILQHMQVSHLANTSLINLVTTSCEYLFRSPEVPH